MSNSKSNSEKKKVAKSVILLAESDAFLNSIYSNKLEAEGYRVILASDGQKALELIRKFPPDLIVLDLVLPKLNGYELIAKIKRNRVLAEIPIVVLTNLSQKEEVKKAFDLGINEYLIKAHYLPAEIINKIKNVINN